ncbi:MAG: DUF2029 domain-containing protein [Acidobacteria bacterium]|nr:DUF2029 domain-containing protein [Acidobacteriota bacterium]
MNKQTTTEAHSVWPGWNRLGRVAPPFLGIMLACIGILLLRGQARSLAAWDFSMYYSVGNIDGHELFKKNVQIKEQRRLWEQHIKDKRFFVYSIFLKPAAYKLLLSPLSKVPFWTAYVIWATLQVLALGAGLWIIGRREGFPSALWILLPFSPFLSAMVAWGQDPGLIFLVLAIAWELSLRERWLRSGAVMALALVKWNLFLLLVPMLIAQRKWRALIGFTGMAIAGAALSIYASGLEGTRDYFNLMHDREADFLADSMPSVRGILLWLGLAAPFTNFVVLALAAGTWLLLSRTSWKVAFAMGVTACVVLSYHTMTYDLLFLLIPLLLFQTAKLARTSVIESLVVAWTAPLMLPKPLYAFITLALASFGYVAAAREARDASNLTKKPVPN